jgi:hypothetical protein
MKRTLKIFMVMKMKGKGPMNSQRRGICVKTR